MSFLLASYGGLKSDLRFCAVHFHVIPKSRVVSSFPITYIQILKIFKKLPF